MTAIYDAILALHGDELDGWRHLPVESTEIPDHLLARIANWGGHRVDTLGDLADISDAQLLRIDNLGRVSLRTIREQAGLQREKWLRLAAERRLPSGLAQGGHKGDANAEIPWDQMTLRDQFAMRALQGIIPDCGLSASEMAERCYEVADAMVAVRNRLSGWQPIETAPRDGSTFLARDYVGTCLAWFAEGGDELSVRNVDGDTPDPDGFTQWRPLPL